MRVTVRSMMDVTNVNLISKMKAYKKCAREMPISLNQSSCTGKPGFYFKGGRVWVCVPYDRSKIVLWQSDDVNKFYVIGYFPCPCREYSVFLNKLESAYVAASRSTTRKFYRQYFRRMYVRK